MIWAGHVARMGEIGNRYKIMVEKSKGKRPLRIPRRRREDNIITDLREMWWEVTVSMHMAQDGDQWQAIMNTVMNHRVSYTMEKLSTS
jgi:hypothetical protein